MRVPRLVVAAAVSVPILTMAVYLAGAASAPPGKTFMWMHALNTGDPYAYMSWIEQARRGDWLFRVLFTEEPGNALLVHPPFLAMGLAARVLGVSSLVVFHASRLLLAGIVILLVYRFCARRAPDTATATFALLYAVLGSGLGWLFVRPDALAMQLPVDLWMPEAILFLTMLESPLFLFALVLALLILERVFPPEGSARGGAAVVFLLTLVLGLSHPFELISIGATIACGFGIARVARIPTGASARGALAFAAGSAVALSYVALVLRPDPVFGHWLRAARSPSPPPWCFAAAFAPQIALAALAVPRLLAKRASGVVLALGWILATALLLYAPLAQQRRFIAGAQIPLTLLAAQGLLHDLPALARRIGAPASLLAAARRARPALLALFLAGSFATNAIVLSADLAYYARGAYPLYLENEIDAAIRAFADRAPADGVLLASPEVSHFVPALSGRWVVVGHYDMTIDGHRKAAELARFLDPASGGAARRALIDRAGVTHVLLSPYEAAHAGRDPAALVGADPLEWLGGDARLLGLTPIFRAGPVVLLQVAPGTPPGSPASDR